MEPQALGAPTHSACFECGEALLLDDELAAFVRPAHARQERHAKQVHAQCLVGAYQCWQIAHNDVADLDHAQLNQSGTSNTIRSADLDRVITRRGMEAKPRGVALAQRDL